MPVGQRAARGGEGGGGGRGGQDVGLALYGRSARARAQRAEGRARRLPARRALVQLYRGWGCGVYILFILSIYHQKSGGSTTTTTTIFFYVYIVT